MKAIAISKFKATCLAVLEEVRTSGKGILVTRFGRPVAVITPPAVEHKVPRLGTGSGVILGNIVGSIMDESDWEAVRDREPQK
jgi:prevent-host-death family protein